MIKYARRKTRKPFIFGKTIRTTERFNPDRLVCETTPEVFPWHTAEDTVVNVCNSYRYATALRENNVPCEMHIFPEGPHGLGTAVSNPYVSRWMGLMIDWLRARFI